MKEGRNLDKPPASKYQRSEGVLKDLGCFLMLLIFSILRFLEE